MNHAQFWGGAAAPYEIEQSLRFDGTSGKLTRTNPASSGITNAYKWSYSFWLKHSDVSSSGTIEQPLLSGGNTSGGGRTYCGWGYSSSGRFWIGNFDGSAYIPDIRPTDRLWRDPSAWEHFMLVYDTSESTNTDRIKIYSNGVRWNPTGGVGSTISSTQLFYAVNYASKASNIGYDNILTKYFDGYMAEVHFVDGQALDQYDFGEFDESGVWRPIEYTGTYGLNGHYLKFDPSATNGIGHDHSGNGNNFTASGFTTSGTGTDVMSDTPTTNYGTFNPVAPSALALSEGNLSLSFTNSSNETISSPVTMGAASGKFYVEFKYTASTSGASTGAGVFDLGTETDLEGYVTGWSRIIYDQRGVARKDNSNVALNLATTRTAGDILGIAVDCDNGQVRFYVNGTLQHTETGLSYSAYGFHFEPNIGGSNNACTVAFNGGQRAFEQTVPSGYKALNTANLPAPDIADGSDYFQTVLYTGDAVNGRTVTGLDFTPDFLWLKKRNSADRNILTDVVRGATNTLNSDDTRSEASATEANQVQAYTTGGFTIGSNSNVNGTGDTFVAWAWDAGGSGSSNTDGSITSTVSANPTAGFSIVTYTGNGTNSATVGHGLGVAPAVILVKDRGATNHWAVVHTSCSITGTTSIVSPEYKMLRLDAADAEFDYQNLVVSPGQSSSTFTLGNQVNVNGSGNTYVAYCFAEVESYSRIGSYVGNGSSDGPFIFCGFRPAYVWLKGSTFVSNWNIYDSTRDQYNITDDLLRLNSAAAEVSDYGATAGIDLLSNGFKIRTSSGDWNSSGQTFVFCAFAENPFGGSGVSPATAR